MALSLGERLGKPSGPGILLPLWLLTAYIFVASPFFVFFQLAESARSLNALAVATIDEKLSQVIEQDRIPGVVRQRVQALLQQDDLALNYLTLRNADRVVLISRGSLAGQAEESAGAGTRRWRALVYRITSSDRRSELNLGQTTVGYIEYGIAWSGIALHALPRALLPLGLGLLAFILLLYLSPRLILGLAERMQNNGRRPVRRVAKVVARKVAAPAKANAPDSISSAGLSALGDQLRIGVLVLDAAGKILDGNVSAARCLSTEVRRLKGMDGVEALALYDRQGRGMDSPLSQCLNNPGQRVQARGWIRRRDRTPYGVELHGVSGRLPFPGTAVVLMFDRDTSLGDLMSMEERAGLAEMLMRVADEPIAVVDPRGRLELANAAWARHFGYSREALKGMPLAKLLTAPFEARDLAARDKVPGTGVHRLGGTLELLVTVADCDWNGKKGHLLRLRMDRAASPTGEASDETELPGVRMGSHDGLTGLASRAVMMRLLRRELEQGGASSPLLLLVVDVRGFRRINADYGRDTGDTAMAAIAVRLEDAAPTALSVVRLGGDEFALLLKLDEDEAVPDGLHRMARQLSSSLGQSVFVGGAELSFELDIGASAVPQDASSPEDMLRDAEAALYVAKVTQDGVPVLYKDSMSDQGQASGLSRSLQGALDSHQVRLVLTPIESALQAGKISAALAEPEWAGHPEEPLAGIELWRHAAKAGKSNELSEWCLKQIVSTLSDWDSLELQQVPLIMRVPPEVATSPAFARAWDLVRTRYNVSAENSTLLWFEQGQLPAADSLPSGFRTAVDCDLQSEPPEAVEVHCVDAATLSAMDEQAQMEALALLLKRSQDSACRLLIGPVSDERLRKRLSETGKIYYYGDLLGIGQPPRGFGRRLARQGAESI